MSQERYRLKKDQGPFKCCSGPLAGRTYLAGKTYTEIPTEEAGKFDEVKTEERSQATSRKAQQNNLEPQTSNIEQTATPSREE